LDGLKIHPESYSFAEKIALDALGYGEAVLNT
jgi:transcriptional accessory protein Tex/SPT6